MSSLTLTEALAEIKLIDKKVQSKKEFVLRYLLRLDALRDPLAQGSKQAIESEQQAIKSLLERKVTLRRKIQEANLATAVAVMGETRKLSDWLSWKKDVAPMEQQILRELKAMIDKGRAHAQKQNIQMVADSASATKPEDIVVNLDEKKLAERSERLEETLAALDGQLSLKNATVVIDV